MCQDEKIVDKKVVAKKPAAGKSRAQAKPRGKRNVDVVDDDEDQDDEDDEDVQDVEDDEGEESDVYIAEPPEYSLLDDLMKLTLRVQLSSFVRQRQQPPQSAQPLRRAGAQRRQDRDLVVRPPDFGGG
jgi:hypothetical protein